MYEKLLKQLLIVKKSIFVFVLCTNVASGQRKWPADLWHESDAQNEYTAKDEQLHFKAYALVKTLYEHIFFHLFKDHLLKLINFLSICKFHPSSPT